MRGNGKHRWKISFSRRTTKHQSPPPSPPPPPPEFLCPITNTLMSDPVTVSSGQTFDRVSVQVCLDLHFSPVPDFSTLIPNLALKQSILSWCLSNATEPPPPLPHPTVENLVRSFMLRSGFRVSERALLNAVDDSPPVLFSNADSELMTHQVGRFSSSTSEVSVIIGGGDDVATRSPLLPPTPRPACYSSHQVGRFSSSSSEVSVIIGGGDDVATRSPLLPPTPRPACYSSASCLSNLSEALTMISDSNNTSSSCLLKEEEGEIVSKLKSCEIHEQEQAVIVLRKLTRTREESRVPLCSPRLVSVLLPLISSRYAVVQTNAIASLVNLSLEKENKVKIVRSGFVPTLIDVLKRGSKESQEHAAGALFSLALEDENKMAIGVLGALQPLMHSLLRSESDRTRYDSALALYHLSLIHCNRVKLVKLDALPALLSVVRLKSGGWSGRVLLILCNLASCNEGRSAMLDANAVAILVGMLREVSEEVVRENCVAALFALAHGSMRFKGLAKEARAVEVLREVEETGSKRAREKAKMILMMMRGRGVGDEGRTDWREILESGGN